MLNDVSWTHRFEIKPKRWVYVPTADCSFQGRLLLTQLKRMWIRPEYYYHLKQGGHVYATKLHLHNIYFAKLDLADFFGSISRSRITRVLREFFPYKDARRLAKMSTLPHGGDRGHSHSLPYGFVQSPMLASLCLAKSHLGVALKECSKIDEICMTVYMDDILLSSKSAISLQTWYENLIMAADRSKFLVNLDKSHGPSNKTTVFNITLSHMDMKVDERRFETFMEEYQKSENPFQKNGIGAYVGTVSKAQALQLDVSLPLRFITSNLKD